MTVMLYPSKLNPKGYRVQDKIFKVQKYFPFSKFKTFECALEAAEVFQEELDKKRKYRELRSSLELNQVFDEVGRVKGMRVGFKTRKMRAVPVLVAQITVDGKQVSTDVQLVGKTFKSAFETVRDWILKKKGLSLSLELRHAFNQALPFYHDEFEAKILTRKGDDLCKLKLK
ncbi:hypothetical protein TUMSATVNIG1_59560 (plasmid) [Vibrio nigripulchritudo]|uniref:hypothetical protein n=1 Tax=Vibrio nigripulchritudo TaxID=28173 RepID=UPI00190B6135|nr:hypothetical protein [Vibrio nigripulchritudo]BCL73970.1 hypothetical protein VNTUMSATTG_59070 [Vibrio nigripulchritudo]BDU35347.1 hypothetical protein TUMSATVNIG1_59560 [Vibrio nigripulchritudo]